jgi:hypothetical protein
MTAPDSASSGFELPLPGAVRLERAGRAHGRYALPHDPDRVERVVKTLGMVNCTPDFTATPKVVDGFSDLFVEVLGAERGRGARSAVGMIALPVQIPVEVEMVLQISTG